MNILVIHEIDWIKKVPFEPHHLAELFSLQGNNVYVIDCQEPDATSFFEGLSTNIESYHRLYDDANVILIHPASLLVKGFNRISHYLTCKKIFLHTWPGQNAPNQNETAAFQRLPF